MEYICSDCPRQCNALRGASGGGFCRMPAGPVECVIDVSKIADQGVEVGDVLTLSPDNADLSDTLALSAFTVVGKVESATYFSIEREPSTVGNGTVSLIFYTGDDAFSLDVYTDLYILVDGADAQTAFTDGYEDAVRPVMDTLESVWARSKRRRNGSSTMPGPRTRTKRPRRKPNWRTLRGSSTMPGRRLPTPNGSSQKTAGPLKKAKHSWRTAGATMRRGSMSITKGWRPGRTASTG